MYNFKCTYLIVEAVTYRLVTLLASNTTFMFFFRVRMF